MTVRALGKPGNQIVRLFSEPAELLILQHCHEITPSVVSMMEAYAHDLRNPRKYMIIDGADTSRILKSQGLLPPAVLQEGEDQDCDQEPQLAIRRPARQALRPSCRLMIRSVSSTVARYHQKIQSRNAGS
jgi:hypothetical protein